MTSWPRALLAALAACLMLAACRAGAPPPESDAGLERLLRAHVLALCAHGPRHADNADALARAEKYVARTFRGMGLTPRFMAVPGGGRNVLAVAGPDNARPRLLAGAHLDSVARSPGADDNASGVAAMLVLAAEAARRPPGRPIMFAAFTGEEMPDFMTESMGSLALARKLEAENRPPELVLILDGLGWYGPRRPSPLLKNFYHGLPPHGLALIAPAKDAELLDKALRAFADASPLPVQGFAVPEWHPLAFMSDNRPFVQARIPAILAANMGGASSPHYHGPTDTPETLDYKAMAEAVRGLRAVLADAL